MLKTVSSVANALGALNYKGVWDAATNTPTLASGVGTQGDYYVVSVAGTTDLDGITNWGVGDWAAFNGSVWQRVEGGADGNFVNLEVTGDASIDDILLIGQDSGDAFNPDAILRLQRTGDRVFQQFKSDTDEVCAILFGDTSDDVRGQIEWDNSTDSLAFYTNDNDLAATFTSSGNLAFPSGQGIDFSATAGTGTSELLDDYEEGVWNPIIGGSGGQSGQSYTAQNGSYVKVGSMVMCTFDVVLSNKGTITGEVQISGLPFTSANGADFRYAAPSFGLWQNLATAYVYLSGVVIDNSTRMPIRGATAAATALSSIATADINNNARFSGTVVYRAA